MTGSLSFRTDLLTSGGSVKEVINHLNGTGNIRIENGALLGININNLLAQANAILNHQQLPQNTGSNQTSFQIASASYLVQQGTIHNNDLLINAGDAHAIGNGWINLSNNTISYTLTAQYKQSTASTPTFQLPIIISGNLNSPHITPDFSSIAKQVITDIIKQKLEQLNTDKSKKINLKNLLR